MEGYLEREHIPTSGRCSRGERRVVNRQVRETQTLYLDGLEPDTPPPISIAADAEILRTVVEGERLTYGYLFNPAFATEISQIDPLPHQRIAVYDHMLRQARLRFLLADDAGAGKTIMTGLYICEMRVRGKSKARSIGSNV